MNDYLNRTHFSIIEKNIIFCLIKFVQLAALYNLHSSKTLNTNIFFYETESDTMQYQNKYNFNCPMNLEQHRDIYLSTFHIDNQNFYQQ